MKDVNSARVAFCDVIDKAQQDSIATLLRYEDKCNILLDPWEIENLGHGQTVSIASNKVIEKGGVGVSYITTNTTPPLSKTLNISDDYDKLMACGISIVMHPINPFAPSFHANSRMIVVHNNESCIYWFGGGLDLTPYFLFEEDAFFFHNSIKGICDKHYSPSFYKRQKKACDEYFYNAHRKEGRGIGGIFFDKIQDRDIAKSLAFMQDITYSYMNIYSEILEKRHGMSYTEEDRKWQSIRRGRYVEFNLCYDRGTLFGLQTSGRIESIMMSMPPIAHWEYCHEPDPRHHKILSVLKNPVDWANELHNRGINAEHQ